MQVKSERHERERELSRKPREDRETEDLLYYLLCDEPRRQAASLPSLLMSAECGAQRGWRPKPILLVFVFSELIWV